MKQPNKLPSVSHCHRKCTSNGWESRVLPYCRQVCQNPPTGECATLNVVISSDVCFPVKVSLFKFNCIVSNVLFNMQDQWYRLTWECCTLNCRSMSTDCTTPLTDCLVYTLLYPRSRQL